MILGGLRIWSNEPQKRRGHRERRENKLEVIDGLGNIAVPTWIQYRSCRVGILPVLKMGGQDAHPTIKSQV